MKKLKPLFFIMMLPLINMGQEFAPPGATWYYGFYSQAETDGYNKIEYVNDTLISNQNCKILRHTMVIYYYPWMDFDTLINNIYVYQENSKVYCLNNDTFYLLYDFGVSSGDTWAVAGIDYGCDTVGNVIVDSISSELINSEMLDIVYLNFETNSEWAVIGKVIEKMGAIENFMLPITNNFCGTIDLANRGGLFRCYYDNSGFSYSIDDNIACDFINTAVNELNSASYYLYPNPTNGLLFLNFFGINTSICIYDLRGGLIECKSQFDYEINIGSLPTGVYILSVNDGQLNHNQLITKY